MQHHLTETEFSKYACDPTWVDLEADAYIPRKMGMWANPSRLVKPTVLARTRD